MKLSDYSPAIGIATGEGVFGKLASKGLLGSVAEKFSDASSGKKDAEAERDEYKKKLAEMQAAQGTPVPAPPMAPRMKAGGVARSKASKRADGIAKKGFTRAK